MELNGGAFSMPNGATFSERQVVIQATEFLRSIVKAYWSTLEMRTNDLGALTQLTSK